MEYWKGGNMEWWNRACLADYRNTWLGKRPHSLTPSHWGEGEKPPPQLPLSARA